VGYIYLVAFIRKPPPQEIGDFDFVFNDQNPFGHDALQSLFNG